MRHFEEVEQVLKERILHMGGLIEDMMHHAIKGLLIRDEKMAQIVFAKEEEVNQLHIEIDDRCLKFISLSQPQAQDLRFVIAALKINSDMERIGDQAVNIAQTTGHLLQAPQLKNKLFDIPRMADLAKDMVRESLDAFVKKDVTLAEQVVSKDSEEDALKSEAFNEFLQLMQTDSSTIQRCLGLILISRNLERIADHATNIAEDVIFMVKGKDIRHQQGAFPQ